MKIRVSIVRAASAFALAALLCNTALAAANEPAGRAGGGAIVGVVNVNSATAEELSLLPGVGPAKAQAILEYRKEHGAFKRVEDLSEVKGIGDKALESMRPHIALDGKTTAQPGK
jgi:comEA protein